MASLFTDILQKALRSNAFVANARQSRNWLTSVVANARVSTKQIMNSPKASVAGRPHIGSMLLFQYEPKLKKQLPLYDRYPLIFPFRITSDGFYGINLHYCPIQYRAILMDSLYQISELDESGERKVMLNYQILSKLSKAHIFKHCTKHYLNKHVRTNFIVIPSKDWEVALFLPLDRFAKGTREDAFRGIGKK